MDQKEIKKILLDVSKGKLNIDEAIEILKVLPYTDLGHTKVDNHRELRTGAPEVIFCMGKTVEQVVNIFQYMLTKNSNILATRADRTYFEAVKKIAPDAEYNEMAKTIVFRKKELEIPDTYIAVVTAGTSDIPVAEEAAITAEFLGNRVVRTFDVGVAGIHRLYNKLEMIREARVIIVIAGMEGALASVVGGLVDKPIIAVPTSVGYGANFSGLSALLGMLTSCANGVSVVNIDNGFGAGYMANLINRL